MTRIADHRNGMGLRTAAGQRYQKRLTPMARNGARQTAGGARQAVAMVAPYASTIKARTAYYAGYYAGGARHRLAPKVSRTLERAQDALPPKVEHAMHTAARRTRVTLRNTRTTMRNATDYTVPKVEHAMVTARTTAEPVAEAAVSRGSAAVAALRGKVTAEEIEKLARKRAMRERGGQIARRFVMVGAMASGGYAAWRWWSKQTHPDWMVEDSEATEAGSRTTFDSVDGTGPVTPDPQEQARLAEEAHHRRGKRGGGATA